MPYPGGRKQLTAVFLNIKRQKGEKAAQEWYRKAQREGYAPKDKRKARKQALRKMAKR